MKVYTAKEDADHIERVWFWWLNVTWRATKAGVWLGAAKYGFEAGLGFVDLVPAKRGAVTGWHAKRYYGPILIKFKRSEP